MIDFVQIKNLNLETIGIIDTAKSVIWHKVYYSVGDFEIYVEATETNINLLSIGNYVTRLNDDEIGIIEKIEITRDAQNGLMALASGHFAKILLDRRVIYNISGNQNKATTLTGNVESAARALVANNATSCTFNPNRNISILELGGHSGSTEIIVDENGNATVKQVTNENLLSYTDALLREYKMSAKIVFSPDETKLQYKVFSGIDRSANNSANIDAVIFSTDFDNLTQSDYSNDSSPFRNAALVGGEGTGLDRFYSVVEESNASGINRREVFIDASDTQRKYETGTVQFNVENNVLYATFLEEDEPQDYITVALNPATGILSATYPDEETDTTLSVNNSELYVTSENTATVEQEYTDAEYADILKSRGKLELAQRIQIRAFNGSITTDTGMWIYNIDYSLGDIVTVQDNAIGVYANVRIIETTEVQDDSGYSVELKYE